MERVNQTAEEATLTNWLAGYLRAKGKRGRTEELMAPLFALVRPFAEITRTGRYPLAEWTALNSLEVAAAIEAATGESVKELVPLSVGRGCTTDWRETVSLQARLADSDYQMRAGNWTQEVSYLRDQLTMLLFEALRRAIAKTAGPALRAAMSKERWHKGPGLTLTRSVEKVVLLEVGFAKNGDREGFDRVAPLARVLPRLLILGAAVGEPRTWLVVVA